MRKIKLLSGLMLMMATTLFLANCGDDNEPATFTLVSLTAGDVDLAGVTSAVNVPEDAVIEAVFSSDVEAATATTTTIDIKDGDGEAQEYSVAISGATVTITPTNGWPGGSQFTIELASTIAGVNGAVFAGNSLTFRTSGIFVPNRDTQVLHLSFDDASSTDETGLQTVKTVGTVTYDTDRRGTASASAYFDGNGGIVEVAHAADLVEGSKTISFWYKTALADYEGAEGTDNPQTRFLFGLGVERGYMLELGRRSNDATSDGYDRIFMKMATNHVNVGTNSTSVPEATAWTELNADRVEDDLSDETRGSGYSYVIDAMEGDASFVRTNAMDDWVHFVMVVDGSAQTKTIFVDGEKWATFTWKASGHDWLFGDMSLKDINNDGSALETIEGSLAIGFAGSSTNEATGWANHTTNLSNAANQKKFFKGGVDEFRIFSIPFSDADVKMLYDNEK
ncbi:MAG: Ig-like domain-containing protein [Cyclobacteriaceae bacterium]